MAFNLEITNLNLVAYQQELLNKQPVCHLTIDIAAGSSTLTVDNILGFSIGKYILLGNFGEANAEIIRIHASTAPSGSTITLASNTVYDHYTDTPVTVIDYSLVEYSRSTTLAGSKTTLGQQAVTSITRASSTATVTTTASHGYVTGQYITISGAVESDYNGTYVVTVTGATTFTYTVSNSPSSPATGTIVSADSTIPIEPNRMFTTYTDLTNTTGYGFYRFKNFSTAAFSDYSGGVDYTGNDALNSFQAIAEEACSLADVEIDSRYSKQAQLLRDANEGTDMITQMQNWVFELISDDTSISVEENVTTYDLSDLTYTVKYPGSYQGMLDVRLGNDPLAYVSIDDMDDHYRYTSSTTLASTASVGATSITLTDSTTFQEQGTVYVGSNVVTYTANDTTTGILSGISSSDITVQVASGAIVWQNIAPTKPRTYTVFRDQIILGAPVETQYAGYPLKFRYLKKLNRLTNFASVTEIPFFNALSRYVAYKIETRKRVKEDAAMHYAEFEKIVAANSGIYKLPQLEEQEYYLWSSLRDWPGNDRMTIIP